MTINIVHLDDDVQTLERFNHLFKLIDPSQNVSTRQFETAKALLAYIRSNPCVDVILLDVSLSEGDQSGVELAGICRRSCPESAILMCSAARDLSLVRQSLANGADDFITKDWEPHDIAKRINFTINLRKMRPHSEDQSPAIAGSTMRLIKQRIPLLIDSAVNCIYIEGESGTGKEVVAELFEAHNQTAKPFIKVNCASIPLSLLQSELFGHVKGAFTGAISDKKGLLETANGGWIFLDEIATLPSDAQAGLLRAIENQSIRKVGSNQEIAISLRIISATNEPLGKLVEQGKFRKDLWQRLCETQINLPPLRDRRDEIPELIQHFCSTMRGGPYTLAPLVMDALKSYDWTRGNIRELRNCLRAMTEKSSEGMLTPSSLPDAIWQAVLDSKNRTTMRTNHGDHSITLSWTSEIRPKFEYLAANLLLEIIRAEYRKNGPMSMRSAAKVTGIPKSTMPGKLEQLVDQSLISRKELQLMVKSLDTDEISSSEP